MDRKLGKRLSYLMNHHRAYANEKLKLLDMTYAQANVLLQLKVSTSLNQDELAKRMLLDKARISRLVKQLEEKGYIDKKLSTHDHRAYDISISTKGKAIITDIILILKASNEHMLQDFSDEEVIVLFDLLDRLCRNVCSKEV